MHTCSVVCAIHGRNATINHVAELLCWRRARLGTGDLLAPPRQADVVAFSDPCARRGDGTVACVVNASQRFLEQAAPVTGSFVSVSCAISG